MTNFEHPSLPSRQSRGFLLALFALLALAPWFLAAQEEEPAPAEPQIPAEPQARDEAPPEDGGADEDPDADPVTVVPLDAFAEADDGPVVVGKIDGEITLAASAYVKRVLETAEMNEADAVVFELNTFGGRVDAAVAIRDALLDSDIPIAVFINRRAISAGALISLACDAIVITDGGTIGAATPIQTSPGQETAEPVAEKYVSYFREEMRSTAEVNGRDGDIAEAMVDSDKEIPGVTEEGKLLTLSTRTALEYGIADFQADSLDEAIAKLGLEGDVQQVGHTWAEGVVAFLTSPAIASLLFSAMLLLGYLEFQTSGFGVFGYCAIVCFMLLFFGHYMVNLAGWEEALLFGIGVVLVLLEIFVTPGFGVMGVLGTVAILVSLVMLLMAGDWSDFTISNPFTLDAVWRVAIALTLSLAALLALVRYLPSSRFAVLGGPLILQEGLAAQAGYSSHEEAASELVGRTGTTVTALRPSGKARIDGRRLNVETEGDFIDADESVRVLRHEPGRVVVRRA